MASLGKVVTLFLVILVATDAQKVPDYFSLYGSPSVSTYTPSNSPSPSPPSYPSPSSYPTPASPSYNPTSYPVPPNPTAYPATNYPNAYPTASYPSNVYKPPATGYNQPATGYNQPATGYNQPATGYNQPATGYNQPATGYNQPATGYNQPATGYNQPATGYNQPATGYNPQAQSPYNYVYPVTYNQGPYTAPLAPQYVAPYPGYANGGYNANTNNNCTDQSCKTNECCEFNGKRFVCVVQEDGAYSGFCVRPKRCYSNGDCPASHCCVIRLDLPFDATQQGNSGSYGSYGSYGAQNSYDAYGNYRPANYKTERGECLLSALFGTACRRSVEGSETSTCPCETGNYCKLSVANPLTGVCTKT
ncbi:unnamed protein product [Lymnaea stagnalis]|uniref:Uncharacterized protein n=1 Tax=Lymnaea stagnalis TaxID=6523 RepID=A0AAV2HRG0_LYMST